MRTAALLALLLAAPVPVLAWDLFGPRSYEDCLLENLPKAQSDAAARGIQTACRKKFPEPPQDLLKDAGIYMEPRERDCSPGRQPGPFDDVLCPQRKP